MGSFENFKSILALAQGLGCRAVMDEPLSGYTSFKIGGPAKLLIEPCSVNALSQLLSAVDNLRLNRVFLGKASNVLVSDTGFDGVVFRMAAPFSKITVQDNYISAEAGAPLSAICWQAYKNNLSGLEFAWGIPGSLGGAVYMNAGAYDGEICQVAESVTALSPQGELTVFKESQLGFSYRHSVFTENNFIILQCTFRLTHGSPTDIRSKMDDLMGRRRDKQPLEFPSAGSFFKRPPGHFAGKLIEDAGLKGFAVGGAGVSEKHAGFLINKGNATFEDLMGLANSIRRTVFERSGVYLEMEPKILTESGWMEEGKQWL